MRRLLLLRPPAAGAHGAVVRVVGRRQEAALRVRHLAEVVLDVRGALELLGRADAVVLGLREGASASAGGGAGGGGAGGGGIAVGARDGGEGGEGPFLAAGSGAAAGFGGCVEAAGVGGGAEGFGF